MSDLLSSVQQVAKEVGQYILPYFSKVVPEIKEDGSWLTEADTWAHNYLSEQLPKIVNLPVLSEETSRVMQLDIIENSSAGYWCVDPLDGTSNFTHGIGYWCISIALIEHGKVTLGLVYDPNRDECFSAIGDQPASLNGEPIVTSGCDTLKCATAIIDFKRIPKYVATELGAKQPYRSQRNFGANALDLCWIATGRCQLYYHGMQRLWDYAAASIILSNSGSDIQNIDGTPVFQNDLVPKPIVASTTFDLNQLWRDYLINIIREQVM